MAEFLGLGDRRIGKNAGLNAIGLQRGDHRLHAADLDDGDFFLWHQTEMLKRQARADVDRSAEAGDADGLAFQLFGFFNLRPSHQVLHQRVERRADDHDIGAAQRGAGGGAAGDLQKLHFAGDQRIHAFDSGRSGDDFDVQAMLVENSSFTGDPGRAHH